MKVPIVSWILALLSVIPSFGAPALTTLQYRASVSDLILVGTATDSTRIKIEEILKGSHDSRSVTVTEKFGYDENDNQYSISTRHTPLQPKKRYLLFLVNSKDDGAYHLALNYLSACKIEEGVVDHRGFDFRNANIALIQREIRKLVNENAVKQSSADQHDNASESKPESEKKPQPESEVLPK